MRAAAGEAVPVRITWPAAAAIAFCYYLSQSAWLAGLGFWTLYRPLVGGALTGLILGDPWAGAQAGAAINLAYLGFIATGGTLPSDISLAGYLGAALVVAGGLDTKSALVLTVPVGLLGYLIYQARMTLDVAFVHWADRAAARGDARGVAWANVGPAQALLLVLCVVPCFLGAYYGPARLGALLAALPAWLTGSLQTVGGMLPALGIAMSLSLFWRGVNGAFFVLAFVICALVPLPILPFAVMAVAVAVIAVSRGHREAPAADAQQAPGCAAGEGAAGAASEPLLRRRDLWASWLNWLFFSHASYNYERMQGAGFAHSMAPILRRLYSQGEPLAEGLKRHLAFYNAEPNVGALVNGTVAALEEARAAGRGVSGEAIVACKIALMGPISGLGDTLIQGTLAPILLSLGVALTLEGSLLGPVLYTVLVAGLIWGVGWTLYLRGYREGRTRLASGIASTLRPLLEGAEIAGSGILGALAASVVQLQTPWVIHVGAASLRVQQDLLDKILPHLLPLALVTGYLVLLRRRVSPGWLVVGTCAVALAGRLAGAL